MQRFFTLKKLVPTSPILGSVLANSTRTSFNMAWRSHGISNKNMVDVLNINDILKTPRIIEAMKSVDRGDFCPRSPYSDSPKDIGFGATISAPHMHAHSLEILESVLKDGAKVLDVGCGSGYLTAVFAKLVGENGKVVGIDHIQGLVQLSRQNIMKNHKHELDSGHIQLVVGDGRKGFPPDAPYDVIHVGAAAPELPQELVDQLASPGKMLIPVGEEYAEQSLFLVQKDEHGNVSKRTLMGVMFVPLTDREKQLEE